MDQTIVFCFLSLCYWHANSIEWLYVNSSSVHPIYQGSQRRVCCICENIGLGSTFNKVAIKSRFEYGTVVAGKVFAHHKNVAAFLAINTKIDSIYWVAEIISISVLIWFKSRTLVTELGLHLQLHSLLTVFPVEFPSAQRLCFLPLLPIICQCILENLLELFKRLELFLTAT